MDDIDQRNDKICDGVLYMASGSTILSDERQKHEPAEMIYTGIGTHDKPNEEIEYFYIFECPVCGNLRSV